MFPLSAQCTHLVLVQGLLDDHLHRPDASPPDGRVLLSGRWLRLLELSDDV
jgi:hypothetical protein